jgi:hypothetical protein
MVSFPLRRLTTWCVIGVYCLVASGLPLPLGGSPAAVDAAASRRLAGKDRSTPFPCMDKPCGCATAEQCFSNCCCNTPAELLAWARARRIEPAVIAALQRRVAAPPVIEKPSSCCAVAKASGCCEEESPSCCESSAPEEDRPHERDDRVVVLRAMLACGGIVAQWCAAAGALPPPVVESPLQCLVLVWIGLVDEVDDGPAFSPQAPPPRLA